MKSFFTLSLEPLGHPQSPRQIGRQRFRDESRAPAFINDDGKLEHDFWKSLLVLRSCTWFDVYWSVCADMVRVHLRFQKKNEPSSNLYRCGKNYQQGQPVLPPKGAFRHENRRQPVFRCLPRVRPYLSSDGCSSTSFLIEYTPPAGSDDSAIVDPLAATPSTLTLTVVGERLRKVYHNISLDYPAELPFSLCGLPARKQKYTIKCVLDIQDTSSETRAFEYKTSVSFLPVPPSGSVTKLDQKTGALMTRSSGGSFEPIFPIGFYINFGGYLARNLAILDELKAQG